MLAHPNLSSKEPYPLHWFRGSPATQIKKCTLRIAQRPKGRSEANKYIKFRIFNYIFDLTNVGTYCSILYVDTMGGVLKCRF